MWTILNQFEPSFQNLIKGGDTISVKAPGLPNITGSTNTLHVQPLGPAWSATGALELLRSENYGANDGSANASTIIMFNAAHSNAIYGASTTVQPPAIVLIPQIKI